MSNHNGTIVSPECSLNVDTKANPGIVSGSGSYAYFASGARIVSYDVESSRMTLLPLNDNVLSIKTITISINEKYLACVENTCPFNTEQISIYNLFEERRIQILDLSKETHGINTASISFSDDKWILQCCEGNWECICWRWATNKIQCRISMDINVKHTYFHPSHTITKTAFTITHQGFKIVEVDLKASKISLRSSVDSMLIRCFCWLTGGMVIVDDMNCIHIYQDESWKEKMDCNDIEDGEDIMVVSAHKNGFIIAGNQGTVIFYDLNDKLDSEHLYIKSRTLNAPSGVLSIAVMMGENVIAFILSAGQIGVLNLEELAINEELTSILPSTIPTRVEDAFTLRCGSFTETVFRAMDICSTSHCFGAITENSVFCLWSYENQKCILTESLPKEAQCLSFHVSGHMVCFGMKDKLRLYQILTNKLHFEKAFPIKNTSSVKFSSRGNWIATVCRSNTIHIYEVFGETKNPWRILKGHISFVTDLSWRDGDDVLFSVGAGGACYAWDPWTGHRITSHEYVNKACVYTRVLPGPDGSVLLQTKDGKIQWIQTGKLLKEISTGSSSMVVLEHERTLLYGIQSGEIRSLSLTTTSTNEEVQEIVPRLHSQEVAFICASRDGSFLVTSDIKGVIMLSKMQHVTDGVLTDSAYKAKGAGNQIVLTSMEDVNFRDTIQGSLKTLILAERKNGEYKIAKETQDLKEIVKTLKTEKEQLVFENNQQQSEVHELKRSQEKQQSVIFEQIAEKHRREIDQIETLYRKRLDVEIAKYRKLQKSTDDALLSLRENAKRVQEENRKEIETLHISYKEALEEKQRSYGVLLTEKERTEQESSEFIRQVEADNDLFIEKMQMHEIETKNEVQLAERQLKAKSNILQKSIQKLNAEKIEDQNKIEKLKEEVKEVQTKVHDQMEIVAHLQREELRREIQELEKHRYVLHHRAEKYKEDVLPKDERIVELETELKRADERKVFTMDAVCHLKSRLRDTTLHASALQKEVKHLRIQRRHSTSVVDPSAMEESLRILTCVEQRREQLQKMLEAKEKASRNYNRKKFLENQILMDEIADLKKEKTDLEKRLVKTEQASREGNTRRVQSASTRRETSREPMVTVQRIPVTRPGSMRQYEWGSVSKIPARAASDRRRRPQSAVP